MATAKTRRGDDAGDVNENDWFSGKVKTGQRLRPHGAAARDRRILWGIGAWMAAVGLVGLALGAFGSSTNAAASANTERELRARAKQQTGMAALESLPLDAHLDRLAQLGEKAGALSADGAPKAADGAPATGTAGTAPTDKAATEKAPADKAPADKAATERAPADKAPADKAPKVEPAKKDATRPSDTATTKTEAVANAPKPGADTTPKPSGKVDMMKMSIDAVPATPGIPRDPNAKPADAKPTDTKAADAKPADTKPADTKPADVKPADAGDAATPEQALAAAKSLLDGGRWADAKAAYDRVLAKQPGNASALFGRGSALYQLKQTAAALADMEAVLKVSPKHSGALVLAGALAQATGKTEAARAYYSRYVEAYPSGRKAAEIRAILERL